MGVIGLNSFVENFYASCTKKFPDGKSKVPVDYIYFDMNSVLHEVIRSNNIILHEVSKSAELAFCRELVKHVDLFLKRILQTFVPLMSVSIIFDGPVNHAKIHQQQLRRIKQKIGEQCITPGYWLMPLVENEIISITARNVAEITRSFRKKGEILDISIVLHGMRSPGEGEIKIAKELHKNIAQGSPSSSHIIVGADSDLIMVGIGVLHGFNISFFNTVSMKVFCLGSFLCSCWGKCFDKKSQFLNRQLTIERKVSDCPTFLPQMSCIRLDFIFLFLLSGNDYLSSVDGFNPTNMWVLYQEYLRCASAGEQKAKKKDIVCESPLQIQSRFVVISMNPGEDEMKGNIIKLRTQNINSFFKFTLQKTINRSDISSFNECQKGESAVQEHPTNGFLRSYFDGLLWCMNTILKGECPDDHFIPSRYVPSINEIIDYTELANDESVETFQYSNEGPFLPIVHFHLVVQSQLLFDRSIKKYKRKEDESGNYYYSRSTQLSISPTTECSINIIDNKGALKSKAEHYLNLLEEQWSVLGRKHDVIDPMSYLLLHTNGHRNLPILQFYFDQAKEWSIKSLLKCLPSASLPLPRVALEGSRQQGCDHLKKVIELRIHSIVGISPHIIVVIASSTWEKVESLYKRKKVAKTISPIHRKRSAIDLDLPV